MAKAKNSQVTNIIDNFGDGPATRALSPIGGISATSDEMELHDLKSQKTSPNPSSKRSYSDISQSNFHEPGDIEIVEDTGFNGQEPRGGSREEPLTSRQVTVLSLETPGSSPGKYSTGTSSSRSRRSRAVSRQTTEVSIHVSADSESSGDMAMSLRSEPVSASGSGRMSEEEDEFFCLDHMKLCTQKNLLTDHGDCENVVPASEWAEAQRVETDRRNIDAMLKRIDTFAGIMIDERGDLKKELAECKDEVVEDFLDTLEDVIAHFLAKQKEFCSQVEVVHDQHMKTINEQIKRCKQIQKETTQSVSQLSMLGPGSEEYNRLKKKIQDKCPVYEEILRRDFNSAVRYEYQFVPNPDVESIIKHLKSLGDVTTRTKPARLPGFLSQSREVDFSKREMERFSRNDGVSSQDSNGCNFSGATYISNGRMVLSDWNNASVKLFNNRGILVQTVTLPNNPWDVKKIDESRIVVSVPGDHKIFILSYTKTGLSIESSFDAECECWGVVPVNDKFVTICDPWSKAPSLKVFSEDGTLLSFFQKHSSGEMLFQYPEHIATDMKQSTLYVTDSRKHLVLAVTLDGHTVFRYINDKLVAPSGIVADNQGYIYVCGKESNNVHQLNKSGQLVKIVLDGHNVDCPRAIAFDNEGENLLVTNNAPTTSDEFLTTHFG